MKTMAISTSFCQLSRGFYSQLVVIMGIAFVIRIAVSMWGHSGEGKPPMYGDFEAQRHWMEITVNLPVKDWYVDTPDNDLQYWGLDYPPLTAYHMMLNGYIAHFKNPDIVALQSSRGIETEEVKVYMRFTVLWMDALFFIPVAVAYFILSKSKDERESDVLLYIFILVCFPGLIVIDNGHFQYNNVSLGLYILAVIALTQLSQNYDLLGAAVFCLALNYKQMELYHAFPFFFYLFGLCIKQDVSKGLYKLTTLGLVVTIMFLTVWSPFLSSKDIFTAVVQRIFPFNRGLYEDKVANVWCSLSVIIKLKDMMSHSSMALICLVTTLVALLPSSIHLLRNPNLRNFRYACINSSLVFFLFSFHVHEKSILLAALSVCLVVKTDSLVVIWFLLISTFSMLPLLIKDGLLIPTISLCGLFWMVGFHYLQLNKQHGNTLKLFHSSILVAVCLGIATLTIPPSQRYPDIFPLLISIYSCAHFILFAVYFHSKQLKFDITLIVKNTKHNNNARVYQSDNDSSMSGSSSPRNLRRRQPPKITLSLNKKLS